MPPRGRSQHISTHQNLALIAETYLAPGKNLADGATADAEGVIEGDERGGLGHSVALNQRQAQPVPECLLLCGDGRRAGDYRPEPPAEGAVDAAKFPPSPPG